MEETTDRMRSEGEHERSGKPGQRMNVDVFFAFWSVHFTH